MATIYYADGRESKEVTPKHGKEFDLKELYDHVETDIVEIVYLRNKTILVICEEGKLRDKPLNHKATEMYQEAWGHADWIAGTALLCREGEIS